MVFLWFSYITIVSLSPSQPNLKHFLLQARLRALQRLQFQGNAQICTGQEFWVAETCCFCGSSMYIYIYIYVYNMYMYIICIYIYI